MQRFMVYMPAEETLCQRYTLEFFTNGKLMRYVSCNFMRQKIFAITFEKDITDKE